MLVLIGVVVIVVAFFVTLAFSSAAATLIGAVVVALAALISGAALFYRSREQVAYREGIFSPRSAWSSPQPQISQARQKPDRTTTMATPRNQPPAKHNQVVEVREDDLERQIRLTQKYADDYRKKLCADPRMAQLKILTMTWQLSLVRVYVQLRLHQQTRPEVIAPELLKAEATHDPNTILRADRMYLERRATTAIDPADAIRQYQHCVILGDPGMGKTTLLKYLALRCARQELHGLSDVPIHIDLNVFAQSDQQKNNSQDDDFEYSDRPDPLLTFAAWHWEQSYGFPAREALAFMQRNLETGNALVLLDGLDETVVGTDQQMAEKSYERVTAAIRRLARIYANAFIVVTARNAAYQQRVPLPGFTELEVLGFRAADIDQFVRNWFEQGASESGERSYPHALYTYLQKPQLQALASSPLLLALIVITAQEKGKPPDKRAELYEECIDLLLEKWDHDLSHNQKRLRTRVVSKGNKKRLLKEIAWLFHTKRQRYFPLSELYQVMESFLDSIGEHGREKEALEEISIESGLLKLQASGWYGFLHLTLQEYFAALAAKENQDYYAELLGHLEDSWWEEVILLYVGCADDAGPLLNSLWAEGRYDEKPREANPLFHTHLILAGQCLAARPVIRKGQQRQAITRRLFQELANTPFSLTRQQVAEALAENGHEKVHSLTGTNPVVTGQNNEYQFDETVSHRLFTLLSGQDECSSEAQLCIARALGTYGDESMSRKLVGLLSNEWIDVETRMCIAQTLGISGVQSLAPDMVKALPNRLIHRDVRLSMAAALAELMDDAVISSLVEIVCNKDVEAPVRWAIVDALGASGKRSGVADLRELQQKYPLDLQQKDKADFPLRWRILIALAALGENYNDLDLLIKFIADKAYAVDARREIVIALGTLRLPWLVRELLPMLWNEEIDLGVRLAVVTTLEAIGERSIVPTLMKKLTDTDINSYIRAAIATLLGSLGDRKLIAPLLRLRLDQEDDPRVHRSVITAAGRLGDVSVADRLVEWLVSYKGKGLEIAECLNIVDALGRLPDKLEMKTREAILDIARLQHIDTEIHRAVIALLPQLVYETNSNNFKKLTIDTLNGIVRQTEYYQDVVDDAHRALWTVKRYVSNGSSDRR